MFHSASAMATAYNERYPQSGTVDLAAGADPTFGNEPVDVQAAAGVLSFTAGKTRSVRATQNFLVLGNLVKGPTVDDKGQPIPGETVEVPEKEARYLVSVGKGEEVTEDEVAVAQKGSKK